jgi:hypothetical protein
MTQLLRKTRNNETGNDATSRAPNGDASDGAPKDERRATDHEKTADMSGA